MTLPFRRRHHDDESAHDRARALWSTAMLEPIGDADRSWLDGHLAGCAECRLEHDAYQADRQLLRGLRDRPPEPPRDLWARTSAAIERESGRRGRSARPGPIADRLVPARARLPLGVMSGLLVALVVVAVSIAPHSPINPFGPSGGTSEVAAGSPTVGPTALAVITAPIAFTQTAADGSYEIRIANVDEVCPDEKAGCAPLRDQTQSVINLGSRPQALVGSPDNDQIVVVSGAGGSRPGSVFVVPVPGASPTPPATASLPPETTPAGPPATSGPAGSGGPTPIPTPAGAHSIAEGVVVVGEARYSAEGPWLAFSAAPIDGSTGPDLYVWNGVDASASRVTDDHETYFSSWFGNRILASRLSGASAAPAASIDPSTAPASSAGAGPIIFANHPVSFVFDPATGTSTDLKGSDIWLPTVDPTGRFITYWSGTVASGPGVPGGGVLLGVGRLVLDGWLEALGGHGDGSNGNGNGGASASHGQGPATGSAATESTPDPNAVGPAGTPVELQAGPLTAFETRFDPKGSRLAIWVADAADPTVGTLRLVVLDNGNGRVNEALDPLHGVRALKGISIDEGRLAWVTPPGQDGNRSSVEVLAWSGDDFGQVQTVPGEQLTIVR